jgi:hypothetical protein
VLCASGTVPTAPVKSRSETLGVHLGMQVVDFLTSVVGGLPFSDATSYAQTVFKGATSVSDVISAMQHSDAPDGVLSKDAIRATLRGWIDQCIRPTTGVTPLAPIQLEQLTSALWLQSQTMAKRDSSLNSNVSTRTSREYVACIASLLQLGNSVLCA